MSDAPRFLSARPRGVHSARPWSQYSYVNRELQRMLRDLTGSVGLLKEHRVLDYGSATSPYRHLLPDGIEVVGADLPGNVQADVELRPDGSVPLAATSFDLILSTQVLEHVEDPELYVGECMRLLKPGGSLVLSTHGIMYYHRDPEDYWRWTMAGLTRLVERHGFVVVERRGILGLAAVGLQLIQDATFWYVPRVLKPGFALVMQALIRATDRLYTPQARTDNGLVIAVRAVSPGSPL